MTESGSVLMVIPARGGSKRLPRKNLLPLAGKPLLCWTIEAAIESNVEARVVVTSDDNEVLSIARNYKDQGVVSVQRPSEIATDDATTIDAIIHAMDAQERSGFYTDTVILLQPTSPLRTGDDIRNAVDLYLEKQNGSVVSVCKVNHPTAWTGTLGDDKAFEGFDSATQRSQDYEQEYRLNGAIYISSADALKSERTLFQSPVWACVMPIQKSVDIDSIVDFKLCELLV